MNPVPHPSTTRRFGPPPDWVAERHGECATLCIADILDDGQQPFMESLWRPEPAELAALNAGGSVLLGIRGTTHPVVYVGATAGPRHDEVPG